MLAHRIASILPNGLQWALRDAWYARRIRTGTFTSEEPEWARLGEWLGPGDVAIDVGANIGVWARRMGEIVGPTGRVYAFEPMPRTFRTLARTVRGMPWVTPMPCAASDREGLARMSAPKTPDGLELHYQAAIGEQGDTTVRTVTIDSLHASPALIKIDAEGHDQLVIDGARETIARSRPVIITEDAGVVVPGYVAVARAVNVVWVAAH